MLNSMMCVVGTYTGNQEVKYTYKNKDSGQEEERSFFKLFFTYNGGKVAINNKEVPKSLEENKSYQVPFSVSGNSYTSNGENKVGLNFKLSSGPIIEIN